MARQVEVLSNQYDALRIQLQEARTEAALARKAAERDAKQLTAGQLAVGQIAAQGYMTGGFDPTLQLLQSSDPQGFVNRVSIMLQLQHENGDRVTAATTAKNAAERALLTAQQEEAKATRLSAAMKKKVAEIQAKENVLNSAAYKKAAEIFQQTGSYPNVPIPGGNSVGVQALRWALTRRGDPYVWGAAGPDHVRLLGPGHVGLRARRDQPGAPDLRPVERGRARPQRPGPARRPDLPVRPRARRHVHRQRAVHRRAVTPARSCRSTAVPWGSVDGVVRIIG